MQQNFFRRNWKLLLNLVTVFALLVLVIAIRDQFKATFENLFKVHIWALLLIPLIQGLNYDAQTRLYRDLFLIVGNKLSYKELYKSALALNYVNTVFPSAGVSGISYFGARMKGDDITGPKASAVQAGQRCSLLPSQPTMASGSTRFRLIFWKAQSSREAIWQSWLG
jgi:uncharacterized membrane protein YbhN (UPF0104 family)